MKPQVFKNKVMLVILFCLFPLALNAVQLDQPDLTIKIKCPNEVYPGQKLGKEIKVIEYNSGYKPSNPKYYNLRSESYHLLLHWLSTTGSVKGIPDSLAEEMLQIKYNIIGKNKIIIESKDQMKKRMHSPDTTDALTLTFWEAANKAVITSRKKREKKKIKSFRRSAWSR